MLKKPMSRKTSMPRWKATPMPSTHGRRRRFHTSDEEGRLEQQRGPGEQVEQHGLVEQPLRRDVALQVLDAQRQRDRGAVVPRGAPRLRSTPTGSSRAPRLTAAGSACRTARAARCAARPFRRSRRASSDHSSPHGASATQIADLAQQQVTGVEDRRVGPLQDHHHQHRDQRAEPACASRPSSPRPPRAAPGTRPGRRRPGEVGEHVPRTRVQRALVQQVALHEEGVDVGEQADRPDRRGGAPSRSARASSARCSADGRRTGPRATSASGGPAAVIGPASGRAGVVHELVVGRLLAGQHGCRGTAARAAPSRPASRTRRTATRSTGRWAPTGCGSRRTEPARATSASGSSGGSPPMRAPSGRCHTAVLPSSKVTRPSSLRLVDRGLGAKTPHCDSMRRDPHRVARARTELVLHGRAARAGGSPPARAARRRSGCR